MSAPPNESAPPSSTGTTPLPPLSNENSPVAVMPVCAVGATVMPLALIARSPPIVSSPAVTAPLDRPTTAPDTTACVDAKPFTDSAFGPRSSSPATTLKLDPLVPAVAGEAVAPAPSRVTSLAPSELDAPVKLLRALAPSVNEFNVGDPSVPTPKLSGAKKSMAPVLTRRTAPASPSCVTKLGAMDSASAAADCPPAAPIPILDEPSDHSAPTPLKFPLERHCAEAIERQRTPGCQVCARVYGDGSRIRRRRGRCARWNQPVEVRHREQRRVAAGGSLQRDRLLGSVGLQSPSCPRRWT